MHYTYDAAGRQTSKTDGRGVAIYTSYDNVDRITQISTSATSCPAASCISYTYNGEGWLTNRADPSGTTSYSYDAQGRPTAKNTPTGATSTTWDGNGNLTSYTDPTGTTSYGYDAANRVTSLAEPGGSCPASPTFPNSTGCTSFGYDNADHRTSTNYPNGQTIILGFHRDVLQWSRPIVSAVLFLADSNPETGATRIIPGSQYLPYVGTPNNGGTWMDEHHTFAGLLDQALPVIAAAGDVLLFDGLVFHATGSNHTSSDRMIVTMAFRSVDELADQANNATHTVLVRGEQLYRGNISLD